MGDVPVYYWIPEDGDDESHPNVFFVSSTRSDGVIRLLDVRAAFPLRAPPSTSVDYVYRFKASLPGVKASVWLDVLDDETGVPMVILENSHGNSINAVVAKISRVRRGAAAAPAGRRADEPEDENLLLAFGESKISKSSSGAGHRSPATSPPPATPSPPQADFDFFSSSGNSGAAAPAPTASSNLMDLVFDPFQSSSDSSSSGSAAAKKNAIDSKLFKF